MKFDSNLIRRLELTHYDSITGVLYKKVKNIFYWYEEYEEMLVKTKYSNTILEKLLKPIPIYDFQETKYYINGEFPPVGLHLEYKCIFTGEWVEAKSIFSSDYEFVIQLVPDAGNKRQIYFSKSCKDFEFRVTGWK